MEQDERFNRLVDQTTVMYGMLVRLDQHAGLLREAVEELRAFVAEQRVFNAEQRVFNAEQREINASLKVLVEGFLKRRPDGE